MSALASGRVLTNAFEDVLVNIAILTVQRRRRPPTLIECRSGRLPSAHPRHILRMMRLARLRVLFRKLELFGLSHGKLSSQ